MFLEKGKDTIITMEREEEILSTIGKSMCELMNIRTELSHLFDFENLEEEEERFLKNIRMAVGAMHNIYATIEDHEITF